MTTANFTPCTCLNKRLSSPDEHTTPGGHYHKKHAEVNAYQLNDTLDGALNIVIVSGNTPEKPLPHRVNEMPS